ncbi:MAG: hypothetical protein MI976_12565 [Pseudomonadales bacterium]|nr:hypothetical protein [Pseudomonadales bacterium]
MTRNLIWVLVLLGTTVLGLTVNGCASQSDSRLHPSTGLLGKPKQPKVTFVRDQNQIGSNVITAVSINDWVVGTLAPGEYVSVEYPAGFHQVTVKGKTVPLTFKNNREYYFLIEQNPVGDVTAIRRIYPQEAARYMENPNYHTGM